MHKISKLSNGLRVVTQRMSDTASVTVSFFVGSGGRYENMETEYGAAHFIEHLIFKGSKRRPTPKQIAEEVDNVGGIMNAYTAEDHTNYFIKLPSRHIELAMDILSDALTNPLFDKTELERERGVILEEMQVYKDDPARYAFDLVGPLLWPKDTLRSNIIGTEQTISSMERQTLVTYFESLYCFDNMVLSVAGNIDHDEVVSLAEKFLSKKGHKTATKKYPPAVGSINQDRIHILKRQTNQAHIIVAGRGPSLESSDESAIRILCTILGGGMSSRLFMNIREKLGLAYSIFMSPSQYVDAGKFEIYAGVTHDKTAEALQAIADELKTIREIEITESELKKAREQLRGRLIMGLESNVAVSDRLGTQMILQNKITSIDATIKKIESVTIKDVQRTAQEYLQPDLLRLAIIGDFDAVDQRRFAGILSKK